MAILAVDPGKTTGYAIYYPEDGGFISTEIAGQLEFLDEVIPHIYQYTEVVCESYIITPETAKKSQQHYSLEIIGALRYACWTRGIPFTLQSPSAGKSFGTDEKLKRLSWWHKGHGHANDAARHMLLYVIKNGHIPAGLLKEAS